ncbi:sugar 3,4-ketoisomerase [Rhodohalobacter sulfatireducens]|uniref:FdtA/QdtA family cupin domain-containing protein n=1 Tax=Rhodohalobacter sulfatireducens TaxID=2911366 RepID=A0ABS9KIV4_9BACT|nr:FdtA/QdtA family cupin domain-containing protein [Rhodohalobacter sulfatireducens]
MEAVKKIELPKIEDPRGNLTFFEDCNQIPFKIERVFWTYDVPGGETRGGHAYYKQNEFIIALSGSFDVVITLPSGEQERYNLNRSYYGLYVPAKTWRHIENFSTNTLSLHASDSEFNEADYIRSFDKYLRVYEK